ncbi:MAG: hypothetical protein OEO19_20685, partial [Gammaproteobacteria bacterium]|nr:hypothetical protein [Gammaproteobacteria bacterium]
RAIDLYKNRKLSARYIPLNEAATSLYGSLREFDKEHLHIKLSQTFDDKPNGIADYFAIFISQNADIYGKRPPSIILEKIDPNEWSKGSFVEGGKAFSYYQKDQSEYIDLVVKSNELPGLLDILKSQTSIDYGPAPE